MQQKEDVFLGLSVPRAIAKFAIPTILSQLVTLVYNLADTFFVGHTNDPSQVAALTLSFPIFMVLTMVGNLFGIGANSLISRSLGGGNREQAVKASTFAFYGAFAAIVLVIILLHTLMTPILTAIGAVTPETFAATKDYLSWTILYGGIPTVFSLMLAHLIRAEGNTRQASIGVALGGVLNILLDYIFVPVLGMGAKGAGIATCIGNVVAFCYLLVVVFRAKHSVVVLNPMRICLEKHIVKEVVLVGIPAAIMIALSSFVNLVMTHLMSNYGDVSIASIGLAQKISSIVIQIVIGLTMGIMPLLGYSYGRRDLPRVKEICRYAYIIIGFFSAVCLVIVQLFPTVLIRLFTSDTATVEKAVRFLRLWSFCTPGMCFANLFSSIFQALGKWIHALILAFCRQAVFYLPLLYLMDHLWSETGIVCAQPISDTSALILGAVLYAILIKRSFARLGPDDHGSTHA